MKSEAQNQRDLFFFRANGHVAVRLEEQFKVHPEIIETENYVSESFIIHHYQILNQWNSHMEGTKKGEVWMRDFEARTEDDLKLLSTNMGDFLQENNPGFKAIDEEEDEDWDDDDDEDWDDEDDADEDEWDEDEEDWDEDEEDWDEDEEDEEDFEEDEE